MGATPKFIVVVAEKPNMGKDIASALSVKLGKPITGGGLVQYVGNYAITAAIGHLFELVAPEAYGAQFNFPWTIDALPIQPDNFIWELKRKKEPGKAPGATDPGIQARFNEIKSQLQNAIGCINAGDPDREGQLIVDLILREAGWSGKTKRLWLHAQTEEGIIEALDNMKSNQEYDSLFKAGECRAQADWSIGMNGTRAYSALWWKKRNKGVVNVGRVVTPVVGMIVTRENQINNFIPTDHYSVMANIKIDGKTEFKSAWVRPANTEGMDPTGKMLIDITVAKAVVARCNKKPAVITSVTKTPKKERPPLLLNLTELQKLAAKQGYSATDALKGAQELYDKYKLTSYPRVDCQYAPETMFAKARDVLNTIKANYRNTWAFKHDIVATRKSAAFNDTKLEEHFAIIPLATRCDVTALSKLERDIYHLIVRHYLAQFCTDYETQATVIMVKVADEVFKTTGSIPTNIGWRALFGGAASTAKNPNDDSMQENLPDVSKDEKGIADPVKLTAKKTTPPKRFNAITLLDAMANAGQFVTDPEIKKRLKEVSGIGTPATRANVTAKIVSAGFVTAEIVNKVITYAPTPKAFTMVASVPAMITKPDLTAYFESKMEGILKGEMTVPEFKEIMHKMVGALIAPAKDPVKSAAIMAAMPTATQVVVAAPPQKAKRAAAPRKKAAAKK